MRPPYAFSSARPAPMHPFPSPPCRAADWPRQTVALSHPRPSMRSSAPIGARRCSIIIRYATCLGKLCRDLQQPCQALLPALRRGSACSTRTAHALDYLTAVGTSSKIFLRYYPLSIPPPRLGPASCGAETAIGLATCPHQQATRTHNPSLLPTPLLLSELDLACPSRPNYLVRIALGSGLLLRHPRQAIMLESNLAPLPIHIVRCPPSSSAPAH